MSGEDVVRKLISGELHVGDILLSMGKGPISEHILHMVGGRHSHAAIYAGDGELIESVVPRTHRGHLTASLRAHPREFVEVYRHRELRMGPAPSEAARSRHAELAEAVCCKATTFLAREYSRADLLYTYARMIIDAPHLPGASVLLRKIDGYLHEETRNERVTCTELVMRAFHGAGLELVPNTEASGQSSLLDAVVWIANNGEPIFSDILGLSGHTDDGPQPAAPDTGARTLLDGVVIDPAEVIYRFDELRRGLSDLVDRSWYFHTVTPHQLATSPSIEPVGYLDLDSLG